MAVASAFTCAFLVAGAQAETDPALTKSFDAIRASSGITESVTLCRMKDSKDRPSAGMRWYVVLGARRTYVYLGERFRKRMTATELRGVMAHELAHLQTLVPEGMPFWHQQTRRDYFDHETAADALAARWVGRDTVVAALRRSAELTAERGGGGSAHIIEMTYRELKLLGW
jgi:hypothetical protein